MGRNRHWRKADLPGAFRHRGRQYNCLNCLHPVAAHNHGGCDCFVIEYVMGQRKRTPCRCVKEYKMFMPLAVDQLL